MAAVPTNLIVLNSNLQLDQAKLGSDTKRGVSDSLSTPSLVTNPVKMRSSSYWNLTSQIASHIAVLVTVSLGKFTGHPRIPLVLVPLVARMNLHHAKMVIVGTKPSMC